jgi:hypothetical protein
VHSRLRIFGIAGALATVLGATAFATTAPAAPAKENHCAYNIETRQSACYATVEETVKALSGGQVTDITDTKQLTKENLARVNSVSSNFVLTILHEHAGNGGDSRWIYGTAGCGGNYSQVYGVVRMKDINFDKLTSSIETFSNCQIKIFENALIFSPPPPSAWNDTSQPTQGPWPGTAALTAMNDQASYLEVRGL